MFLTCIFLWQLSYQLQYSQIIVPSTLQQWQISWVTGNDVLWVMEPTKAEKYKDSSQSLSAQRLSLGRMVFKHPMNAKHQQLFFEAYPYSVWLPCGWATGQASGAQESHLRSSTPIRPLCQMRWHFLFCLVIRVWTRINWDSSKKLSLLKSVSLLRKVS